MGSWLGLGCKATDKSLQRRGWSCQGDGDGGEDGLVGGEERARMEGRVVELRAVERNGERRREVEVDNIIITDILITILI